MHLWKTGELNGFEEAHSLCYDFSSRSQFKFCPGIDPQLYEEEYYRVLGFHIKPLRINHFPFSCVDSVHCKLWFIPASNLSVAEKEASEIRCPPCRRLVHDLNHRKRKKQSESPSKRIKRQLPSSKAKLQYMSPASQQKRKLYTQYERTNSLRKLAKYEANEVDLNDEQNAEMSSIVEATQPDELKKLFDEGDQHGVGDIMKSVWLTDKNRQKKEFNHDQERNSELDFIMVMVCY